ncbi:flavin monoamine oxidase family protein [Paenibacillus prosopidis]|uniref:Monoamine oxidase n=1 Tax=Paenibacillus prosopidis TaxID=630520 RepID=A0A368WD73_9BACL|nr:NAD(P)/FAD-dependent oxidoreductase [Paenibacillus prosopidis]RCW52087.1 monoamine oxidase [Paenibacillus prosopidis]
MPRTQLARFLRDAYSVVGEALERSVSIDQVMQERIVKRQSHQKREIKLSSSSTTTIKPSAKSAKKAASTPRIVIVGAGLAGLTCAYRLKQAGLIAKVYEASDRVGGRCWTRRGDFEEGQIVERGGELIDTEHLEIRQLAEELGLTLDDLIEAEKKGTDPCYFFDNTPYSYEEATRDFQKIFNILQRDLNAAPHPTTFNNFTQRGFELDHMSIIDWINENVPGGIKSKFGQLLDVAYNIEFGAESSDQSSLNLIYLLGFSESRRPFRIFGSSDERFHIRGGNDQIPEILEKKLKKSQIIRNTALIAIKENSNGSYTLTFKNMLKVFNVIADKVVLTLPFSILRTSVDFSKAGFRSLKITAIEELGMGANTKLHAQFTGRHWNDLGCNGETFSDRGYQNTYEVSRAQPGKAGILVDYTGGEIATGFNRGTPTERTEIFLTQLEPVLPGISGKWNGRSTRDYWPGNPFTKGSYSFWKVGQYTKFAGIEGEREGRMGNCYFAGEHTSVDWQGFLNGGVESGERAASEIIEDLEEDEE